MSDATRERVTRQVQMGGPIWDSFFYAHTKDSSLTERAIRGLPASSTDPVKFQLWLWPSGASIRG
jgi:hypothetical protein